MELSTIVNALINFASYLALALFLLVAATNIIVEVIKGLVPRLPTNLLVFIVAIVITELSLFIGAAALEITVMWYYAIGALVLGIFVAYAAMFGFDKLKELYERLNAFGD